ncbi:hypothetical protein SPI_03238 [Niveomyces insectorum RCEF 264]|uniref:Uncharacterized protein n=1 Tax=Niveomyces insectorum RCEF 264 TaxID=1081102 RepID=A0A167X6H0_9HYPO|nr:hypothetical protein SPI_03238 [Niveomyces insectorum RCEF 264]
MRLASTRSRLGKSASSASSRVFSRCPVCSKVLSHTGATRPGLFPARNHRAIPPYRSSATFTAHGSFRQAADRGQTVEADDRAQPTAAAPTTPPLLSSALQFGYLSQGNDYTLPHSGLAAARPPAESSSGRWGLQHRQYASSLLDARRYGKWRELLFDYDRLMFESGLVPASLSGRGARRSVDQPEHATDICLWSAIFNFAQRRGGSEGALVVWREIFQRKQLYEVDGIAARAFWQAVVASALPDEAFLESIWAYAEYMYDKHGALWPNLYRGVVTYCLENDQYERALRWHIRLSAHFGVAKRDFFGMFRSFLTVPVPPLQDTLRSIYATSRHRLLYDTIIPLLWSRGQSALARGWRETLIRHDDRPTSAACRPFLQYLAGYYPETELCPQEQAIVHSHPAQYLAPPALQPEHKVPDLASNFFHLINRVHGETFGIREKPFNDNIGAKWFATSWVSLDTAIQLVYGLGVDEIGPLSLQSIALREDSPAGVLQRVQQLEQLQIGLGGSNYARAVRHLAAAGDAETLEDLLHSTLHPGVFDDAVAQRDVLEAASSTGDWKTHRLLLAVRLVVSEDVLAATANELLRACLDRRRKNTVLKLLDEFAACGVEVLPSACDAMCRLILADVPHQSDPHAVVDVDFYAALCRRMAMLRLPVPTEAWQNILYILGRQGRLDDFERVALDLVERYVSLHTASPAATLSSSSSLLSFPSLSPSLSPLSPPLPCCDRAALFKVHVADVPDIVRGEQKSEEDVNYRLLPRDLPLDHPLHPLGLVFDHSLVEAIVRWYFHRKMAYRQDQGVRAAAGYRRIGRTGESAGDRPVLADAPGSMHAAPEDFFLAGGIRLLAMLRDRGVAIPAARVRSEALVCIAAVFGPQSMATRYWQPARSMNQLTLREVKGLCDAAWATSDGETTPVDKNEGNGAEKEETTLLPTVDALEKALEAVRSVTASLGSQFPREDGKTEMSRKAFIDALSRPT